MLELWQKTILSLIFKHVKLPRNNNTFSIKFKENTIKLITVL